MLKSPVKIDEGFKYEYSCIFAEAEKIKINFLNEQKKYIIDSLEQIKRSIFVKLIECVKKDDRLPSFDEKIYDYYYELIMRYKKAVAIYDGSSFKLVSKDVIRLLDGLNSVLKSRISQFEEIYSVVEYRYGKDSFSNPVYTEKQSIVEKFIANIGKDLDNFDFDDFAKVCLCCDDINKEFNDRFYDKINLCFNDNLKKCIALLNDIEKRDVTAFYFEAIKEENEILGSVIRIQADALEMAPQSAFEESLIQSILFQLRDAYQHINKHVDSVLEKFSHFDKKPKFEKIKLDKFDIVGDKISQKNIFDENIKPLRAQFAETVSNILKNISSGGSETFEEIKSSFERCFMLCERIKKIFTEINAFYDDIRFELEKSEEKAILLGIYDTVKIKVESLDEGLNFLKLDAEEILNGAKDGFELNEREKKKISGDVFDDFILNSNAKELDEQTMTKLTELFSCKLKSNKAGILEKADKRIMLFKREQLLFEITTFEEIMNYSISRLRQSESLSVKEYVAAVDFAVKSIDNCLEEFGISIIRPASHQMFNGKEHEVLMAEKSVDFSKGEIIRVMNSGFKEKDRVIIRANVIAAK